MKPIRLYAAIFDVINQIHPSWRWLNKHKKPGGITANNIKDCRYDK